jgi:RNA polymerase sigma factor (sigma-70 family)
MTASEAHRAIEAVWRIEAPRLVAGLTRMLRDISMAEELAQDALVVALAQWPGKGVPDNPGAWLMQTAKRRAIDYFRRNKMAARKLEPIGAELREEEQTAPDLDSALDTEVEDDLLRLIFVSCHPVLSAEARVALTLKLIGGLTVPEIARAFLAPEPTIAQRLVRAKRTIAAAHVPFEVPRGPERAARLGDVLEVIYLIFNEGYAATAGEDWMRPELAREALRLGRILVGLAPGEAEVHGLVALMEIQASRFPARRGRDGEPVLLLEQDRGRWDQLLIRRGLKALARAEALGGLAGPYTLQAAIAAVHARAPTAEATQWGRIAALYDVLARVTPSPVVELNRGVAHAFAFGPAAGLAIVDAVAQQSGMAGYHLLPAVRGDLLEKLGRAQEARAEFSRAAELAKNGRERELMEQRAAVKQ